MGQVLLMWLVLSLLAGAFWTLFMSDGDQS